MQKLVNEGAVTAELRSREYLTPAEIERLLNERTDLEQLAADGAARDMRKGQEAPSLQES
jgi:hypothetical protein